MAITRPTLTDLVATGESEINALITGADARMRFSVFNVFARVWGMLTDGLYSSLVFLSRQLFLSTATRIYLERIAESYGILRLPAAAAQGCALVYGVSGTLIPFGTVLQRADGVQYKTTSAGTISNTGFVLVNCTCEVTGQIGNAAAGVALQLITSIIGVTTSEVCADAIGGGSDIESDDALRARTYQRLQNPPGAGTESDWTRWAFALGASVTRVWVIPTVYGNGSVGIVFAEDNNAIIPPPSRITAMQNHLAQFVPVGSNVYVFAPTLVQVPFTIHAEPANDAAVKLAIADELKDLLYREAGAGKTIPLSRVNEAISSAAGEVDHTLTVPSAPLVFASNTPVFEVGTLGTITWG